MLIYWKVRPIFTKLNNTRNSNESKTNNTFTKEYIQKLSVELQINKLCQIQKCTYSKCGSKFGSWYLFIILDVSLWINLWNNLFAAPQVTAITIIKQS